MIHAIRLPMERTMNKNLIDLKNYQPDVNELGEIKIETPSPKYSLISRNYFIVLGYFVLMTIIILGLILPAFSPIEEQKEESPTEKTKSK
jgi:hypothetical protein